MRKDNVMTKPKYYLKPFWMCKTTWGLSKDLWERIRHRNMKPVLLKKLGANPEHPYDRFSITDKEAKETYNWWVHYPALTQRLFIEEKEARRG